MGFHRGPKIVTNGLVLALDAANPKSYPTTGTAWSDLSGNNNNGTLTNGPQFAYAGGNGSLTYTMVNNSSGHPTTTEGLTTFFNNGTSVITGTHIGQIAWGDGNQAIRWGGNAGAYPSYHTRRTYYGWKVDGFIYLPETGNYEFLIDGDDACDFFINGELCSYWYGGHGFGTGAVGSTKYFTQGWYTFTARMEEQDGGDGIAVGWKKPSDSAYSTIPGYVFSTTNPNLNVPASSIAFDGTNDYVTLGTPSLLNGVQVPLTICMWAKSNSFASLRTLWGVYSNTSAGRLYSLIRVDSGTLKYYASNSTGGFQVNGTFVPLANVWNFYAVTVSGIISSPVVTIYLNTASETFSYASFTSSPNLSIDFRIGGNQAATDEYWNGGISNVMFYNRALSATEIQQNYNATKSRFNL